MSIASVAGYIWLYRVLLFENSVSKLLEGCLVKHVTNIPCPSWVHCHHQLGMEHIEGIMINNKLLNTTPEEYEAETASNSYLMSLIGIIVGLPLPIINVFATLIFYMGNRKGTYFIRWHCTQALLSQFSILFINSFGFWWTISIFLTDEMISNNYIAYIIAALLFNITEFIATIYTAIKTRKGIHVEWWFYGHLTTLICKPGV